MSLLYRSQASSLGIAEIVVVQPNSIQCILTNTVTGTTNKIECLSIKQAEALVDQFMMNLKLYV